VEEQERQQRPLLGCAEVDGLAVVPHPDRSKDPVLHDWVEATRLQSAFLANDNAAPSPPSDAGPRPKARTRRKGTNVLKKLLTAAAIALTLVGASCLPEVDDLAEHVPPAVRAATP
jgi:hypothetical protein